MKSHPIVSGVKQISVPAPAAGLQAQAGASGAVTAPSTAVSNQVTFVKSEILGDRVFLYGSDLQYSGQADAKLQLTLQSTALGHLPTRFRVVGMTLQLIADQSLNFESDVNHPERLIHEFPISAQDDKTLTVTIDRASPILATILGNAKSPRARSSWIRSLQYIPEGNYLLFESSIEGADGTVSEVLESLFPRDTLVPSDYKVLLADKELEPLADRFRLLDSGPVYLSVPSKGRVKTSAATRFLLNAAKPVQWFITPNCPDEYLPQVRMGVEGWNRYAQAMWGRDMVKFMGKLPAGVKLGDPRYNVINWDSVAMAGAAYESQAQDPATGIQSHSLIYLPLAWINIGKEFWKKGEFSEAITNAADDTRTLLSQRSYMGRALPVNCIENPTMHLSLFAKENPDQFARELLKNVLFHEVGHSWGLAHNFRGSLSDDGKDPKTFSVSIMDYNPYDLERPAYESFDSDKGPLLEYDRQALSVLYNNGKDVKFSDPVFTACSDSEADDTKGGIDPLCNRYDFGHDPTQSLSSTVKLLTDDKATLDGAKSLAHALNDSQAELGDPTKISSLEDAYAKVQDHGKTLLGLVNFYVISGSGSISSLARINLRALYVYKPGVLRADDVEKDMRDRVYQSLKFVADLEKLPPVSQSALDKAIFDTQNWLSQTAPVKSLPIEQQKLVLDKASSSLKSLQGKISDDSTSLLAQLRTKVLGSIARVSTSPFYMTQSAPTRVDYEALTLALLEEKLSSQANGEARSFDERTAYAKALGTYKDIEEGRQTITRVQSKLNTEMNSAPDATTREGLRGLLRIFSSEPGKSPPSDES